MVIMRRFLSRSSVEVGTLCRYLPSKVFEVEFDTMFPMSHLTEKMWNRSEREVEACPGYFLLFPSPT